MGEAALKNTIYDRYGGYNFFHECIYQLYREMYDHPEISYHFVGVDIDVLSKHQTQYLIRNIGGPKIYGGKPIKWVHRNMDITDFQFDEIAKAFAKAFRDKGMAEEDVKTIIKFVASRRQDVVTAEWVLIDKIMAPIYWTYDRICQGLSFLSRKAD